MTRSRTGPLAGLKVLEFGGIGPAPFAAMLLAEQGADVVRIDRPGAPVETALARGKRSIAIDLKADRALAIELAEHADVLIEGYRPGVMERLGLGPELLLARNPALIYGRMTGWGQTGPLAHTAGHDLTYLALSGALHAIGSPDCPPPPPLNLVGDFGGGSLYLVMGILSSLVHARATGMGQVVDAAMVEGAASLSGLFHDLMRDGRWRDERGTNFLDGAAPYYRCYRCADGKWLALAAIEPEFWAVARELMGLAGEAFDGRDDPERWPAISDAIAAVVARRTRDEWALSLEDSDACAAPVLSLAEAPCHPHNIARENFVKIAGESVVPAPAPRFSVTPAQLGGPPPQLGENRIEIFCDWLGRT